MPNDTAVINTKFISPRRQVSCKAGIIEVISIDMRYNVDIGGGNVVMESFQKNECSGI